MPGDDRGGFYKIQAILPALRKFAEQNIEKAKEYYQKIIFDFPSSIHLVDARKKYRKLRGDEIQ